MAISTDALIREAIAGRQLVELRYSNRVRVAEPHDYGVLNGVARLNVFQLRATAAQAGKSERGWRLLDVDKISGLRVLPDIFPGSRGSEHQKHHAWDEVFARVK